MKQIIFYVIINLTVLYANTIPNDLIIDVSTLKAGKLYQKAWNEKAIIIYKRTKKDIQELENNSLISNNIFDSYNNFMDSISKAGQNANINASYYFIDGQKIYNDIFYSLRKDIYVGIGFGGRMMSLIDEKVIINNTTYFCTNSKSTCYDTAGRFTRANSSDKTKINNLYIPPYKFDDNKLIIGIKSRLKEFKIIDTDKTKYNILSENEKLYYGTENCKLDIVKEALKNGADINAHINKWRTIYSSIVTNCHGDINKQIILMKELLNHNPDLDICSNTNYTPLELSIYYNIKVMKLLIEYGANPKFKCAKNRPKVIDINLRLLENKYKYLNKLGFID